MTTHSPGNRHHHHDTAPPVTALTPATPESPGHGPHGQLGGQEPSPWRNRLMMLVCCIPMLVLVVALMATGVAGSGALLFALLCIGMMAAMMFLMPGGHRH